MGRTKRKAGPGRRRGAATAASSPAAAAAGEDENNVEQQEQENDSTMRDEHDSNSQAVAAAALASSSSAPAAASAASEDAEGGASEATGDAADAAVSAPSASPAAAPPARPRRRGPGKKPKKEKLRLSKAERVARKLKKEAEEAAEAAAQAASEAAAAAPEPAAAAGGRAADWESEADSEWEQQRSDSESEAESTSPPARKVRRVKKAKGRAKGKGRGRAAAASSAEDGESGPTYPDPADVDDNPQLLPAYRPSVLPSPALFAHILQHLSAFNITRTTLAQQLQANIGTVSWVLQRKYAFAALGVVKGMREWSSHRDRLIARQCAAALRSKWRWDRDMAGEAREEERKGEDVQQPAEAKEGKEAERQQEPEAAVVIDGEGQWAEAWLGPTLSEIDSSLSYAEFLRFMRHELSLEEQRRVQEIMAEWMRKWSSGAEERRSTAERRQQEREESSRVQVEQEQQQEDDAQQLQAGRKRKGGPQKPRRPLPTHSSATESVQRRVFPSPFGHPSWRLPASSLPLHPFQPSAFTFPDCASIAFRVGSAPACLPAFTSLSSSPTSSFLNVGGPVTALAFAPVGSVGSASASSLPQFLATAASPRTKYQMVQRTAGKGAVTLWRLPPDGQTSASASLCVEHDGGDVLSMSWYPDGVWDAESGRLGVLAMARSDGSVVVAMMPQMLQRDEDDAQQLQAVSLSALPHVLLQPGPLSAGGLFPNPVPTCLCFSPHASPPYLAVGQSNGSVVVYSMSSITASSPPAPSFHLLPRPGHHAVRCLCFSPVNPHHLMLGTGDGYLLIIDLRCPHSPLYHVLLSQTDPVTACSWFSSRPDLFLSVTRDSLRLHSLVYSPSSSPPDRSTALRGVNCLCIAPFSTCWSVACVERPELSLLTTASAWSDGSLHLCMQRSDDAELAYGGSSRIATLSSLRLSDSQRLLVTDAEELELVPSVRSRWKEMGDRRRRRREQEGAVMKAEALASDETVALMLVVANPNVLFPPQFASGGVRGLLRLQTVTEL